MKLDWEELKVAAAWTFGAGFAALVAFVLFLQPIADAFWDRCFGRNQAKAKARISEMFYEEIARWDQAAVDAGAALQVNETLGHLLEAVELQGQALSRISGYLEGRDGWNGTERRGQ